MMDVHTLCWDLALSLSLARQPSHKSGRFSFYGRVFCVFICLPLSLGCWLCVCLVFGCCFSGRSKSSGSSALSLSVSYPSLLLGIDPCQRILVWVCREGEPDREREGECGADSYRSWIILKDTGIFWFFFFLPKIHDSWNFFLKILFKCIL